MLIGILGIIFTLLTLLAVCSNYLSGKADKKLEELMLITLEKEMEVDNQGIKRMHKLGLEEGLHQE